MPQFYPQSNDLQTIGGYVAAPGDFKGEKPETEEAKKKALSGADIVIIPAGVPRTCALSEPTATQLTSALRQAWHDA
jgi:malate/lactate dehydrogenase